MGLRQCGGGQVCDLCGAVYIRRGVFVAWREAVCMMGVGLYMGWAWGCE